MELLQMHKAVSRKKILQQAVVTLSGNPDYSFCGIKISIRAIVI